MEIAPDWTPMELEVWRGWLLEAHADHRASRHASDALRNALGDASILALDRGEVATSACLMFLAAFREKRWADKGLTALDDLARELHEAERN